MYDGRMGRLIGRDDALARVTDAIAATRRGAGGALLVSGSAGIGKTMLLRTALERAGDVVLTWGTCLEGGAPGHWPWTQALSGLVRQVGIAPAREAAGTDLAMLANLVPALGAPAAAEESARGRMLLLDAAVSWLQAVSIERPVVIVLDDLQWADDSSIALLELVVRSPRPVGLTVLGAFRHDETTTEGQTRLTGLVERADHVHLTGLDRASTARLAQTVAGRQLPDDEVDALFRRAGGHPFFTRELSLADQGRSDDVPLAVRDAVERRVRGFSPATRSVLRVAAMTSAALLPDVVGAVTGESVTGVDAAVAEATAAGMVVATDEGALRFAHDLFRETLAEGVPADARPRLHLAIGAALASRADRGGDAAASEIARHFRAAVGSGGLDDAVRWSLRAAEVDRAGLALTEAAAHLRLLRAAVADAGLVLPDADLVDVLLAEADVLARDGRTPEARELVRLSRSTADGAGDSRGTARSALAAAGLGSRFASRRDELIDELQSALAFVERTDGDQHPDLQARLMATLARELTHSVAEQRDLAGPLSERALELGRSTGDHEVLAACLLARHDVLWSPGLAESREEVTTELLALAHRSREPERLAEALLLHANVLLERGRAAFDPTLDECLYQLESLGQLRHRYTLVTRRACVALLRGRLDEAAGLIDEAVAIGERLREPDTGNVEMSQRLELVRARSVPAELIAFAGAAVRHWTGAPVHAHAVAAGFCARAGDLAGARRHVAAVQDLGGWRADTSYLWSVFVRELAVAAVALEDRALCAELLAELEPLAGSCGVNGALIAFAGCHSHTAGTLAAALGEQALARTLLEEACSAYERLGSAMLDDARTELAGPARPDVAALRREGDVWQVTYAGRTASVRDSKGMRDLAVLLQRPGAEVHALDLMASGVRSDAAGPILDRTAADHYRRRLAELAEEREAAQATGDDTALLAVEGEHDALVAELGGGTGLGGRARSFANHPAERARKAVTGRIRDAVRRLDEALPGLGEHLDQHLVTGIRCRYRGAVTWQVDA